MRRHITDIFAELGSRLEGFGLDGPSREVVERAVQQNGWFTPEDIAGAVEAIRSRMLRRDLLTEWISGYPEVSAPLDVDVIMAGNIPLAGFFDMLCVLMSGHNCYVKPSSKDRALMEYMVSLLLEICPPLPLYYYKGAAADFAIASGSDNAVRQLRARYGATPAILRGNRASAALLTGGETQEQLAGLGRDIFSYSGLGCRNVSRLFVPQGYDMERLAGILSGYNSVNPKYINNFRQRVAVLSMQGEEMVCGDFFMLRRGEDFPAAVSEIIYSAYSDIEEAERWLRHHDRQVQCVVHNAADQGFTYPRSAPFGGAQSPSLDDWPDGIDVLEILTSAHN